MRVPSPWCRVSEPSVQAERGVEKFKRSCLLLCLLPLPGLEPGRRAWVFFYFPGVANVISQPWRDLCKMASPEAVGVGRWLIAHWSSVLRWWGGPAEICAFGSKASPSPGAQRSLVPARRWRARATKERVSLWVRAIPRGTVRVLWSLLGTRAREGLQLWLCRLPRTLASHHGQVGQPPSPRPPKRDLGHSCTTVEEGGEEVNARAPLRSDRALPELKPS